MAIKEASLGEHHPDVATSLGNLAALLYATNRAGEAEPLMRRSLEIFVQFTVSNGHVHPYLNAVIGNYAGLLEALGWSEEKIHQRLGEVLAPILQHPRAAELLQALKGK